MSFSVGKFTLGGIGLSAVTGVILNLVLPAGKQEDSQSPSH